MSTTPPSTTNPPGPPIFINTSSTPTPDEMYNKMNSIILNPILLGIIALIFIVYLLFFSSLTESGSGSSSSGAGDGIFSSFGSSSYDSGSSSGNKKGISSILWIIIVIVLIALVTVHALKYFFSVNVTASISDFFTRKPKIDIVVDQSGANSNSSPVPEIQFPDQVFNIPGNTHSYEDAKALCTAYGSRLATYKEIEDSYENGGEWCNYGWSDGQMALFPTQQKTFNNLQKIKGHEHDCGRPGVNGGYVANPLVKYGANCYGKKPRITPEEAELMEVSPPYPVTNEDILFQKRVDYWKNKVEDVLVSPFNMKMWSQII